jgi:large subunit ribosomal protein L4
MATATVYNWEKKKVGEIELPASVFEAPLRKDILHDVVLWQLATRRAGTHKTKTRAFVSGGGKKPFKQKGTGNARQGSSRSPLMPGGAVLFGPQPRDYGYALPKKVRQAGLINALSYLLAEGRLHIVENIKADGKTKELNTRLGKFGVSKAVLIDANEDLLVKRASRNLKSFRYYSVAGMNVYDLLKYDNAIVTKDSIARIIARCGQEASV